MTMIKITAFYRLDEAVTRKLKRRIDSSLELNDPLCIEASEVYVYRGWAHVDSEGSLLMSLSNLAKVREHLAKEFNESAFGKIVEVDYTDFTRMLIIRGWPPFQRLPLIEGTPQPQQESTS